MHKALVPFHVGCTKKYLIVGFVAAASSAAFICDPPSGDEDSSSRAAGEVGEEGWG